MNNSSSKVQVLISCMHHDVRQLLSQTKITTSCVLVNQCDEQKLYKLDNILIIESTERGLSKSRNMALRNASGDICLICDDDEILDDDYSTKIEESFKKNPDTDIIAFQIRDSGKYIDHKKRIGYIGALKLASWQLAFRREQILKNNIWFDESLGSGVSKAGGEENKFLYDCLHAGLKIKSLPIYIGTMIDSSSQWWNGFTEEYFYDRGIMTKKLMGKFLSIVYACYFIVKKYPLYRYDISLFKASKHLFKGILSK